MFDKGLDNDVKNIAELFVAEAKEGEFASEICVWSRVSNFASANLSDVSF